MNYSYKMLFFLSAIQVMIQGTSAWTWLDAATLKQYLQSDTPFTGMEFIKSSQFYDLICRQGYQNGGSFYKAEDRVIQPEKKKLNINTGIEGTKSEFLLYCAKANNFNYYYGRGPKPGMVSVYTKAVNVRGAVEPYGIMNGVPNM